MISASLLERFDLFRTLHPATLSAIAKQAFQREIKAGHTLVIEGLPAEQAYFLVAGGVRVLRMRREGRMQVLARFGPGSPLNVISLLNKDRLNRSSIETLTAATFLVLDASAFERLLQNHPDFSALIMEILAERMALMTDLVANLSLYTVRARLARFLMTLADSNQSAGGWTQEEIASHIGSVRDVVGRLLRAFEAEGLITRERQKITLLDRPTLLREAEQDET